MPSINLRQLRAWLRAGKTVELRERERVIARIVPEPPQKKAVPTRDFEALRKEIFGERMVPGADLLIEERGRF